MTATSTIPLRVLKIFIQMAIAEIGRDTLNSLLAKVDLAPTLSDPQAASRLSESRAAETYAAIQNAFRTYYGRNARSILTRIGRRMWTALLDQASLPEKAQAQFIRALPVGLRRKPALDHLAHFLRDSSDSINAYTQDMDLMLEDKASPSTLGQKENISICALTVGMIQECLYWATGREHDVEEVKCRATGGDDCEFYIRTGA